MSMLSPKRQVTLPKALCDRLHIHPGDEIDFFEHEGRITLIKKRKGASDSILKYLKADDRFTDEESLIDAVDKKQNLTVKGKRPPRDRR